MDKKYKVKPLSGRGQEIIYEKIDELWSVAWGGIKFKLTNDLLEDILSSFFVDPQEWYLLGSSMNNPVKGGLGEYIQNKVPSLTSRHASAIAAILCNKNIISIKGKRPIFLRKHDR